DGEHPRALLRAIGPPYYSLLHALDADRTSPVHAYVERAPRVWVELGYDHPLATRLQPAPGKFALLRAPRSWTYLDDEPFRDVYEALESPLPSQPAAWTPTALPHRIAVPLRLRREGAAEGAELWVLRTRADEQLEALVRSADDRLLARLSFAVGLHGGENLV